MGRDTGGRSGTHGPGKEGACGRGSRRVPPAFMELFGAGGVFFTLREKFFFFPGLQPLRQGTACRVSGRSRGSIAAVPVAWSVPRASRLHGAVRRWRRFFHAPGKIFLFSWAPAAEAGNCLPCRRPEQGGASRPCSWRGLCRVSPAFKEMFGAGGVFFTLRGNFLPMERGKGGRVWREAQPGRMR